LVFGALAASCEHSEPKLSQPLIWCLVALATTPLARDHPRVSAWTMGWRAIYVGPQQLPFLFCESGLCPKDNGAKKRTHSNLRKNGPAV
jgi:hypothetical protein